jgi:hypothetical protein
MGAQKTAIPPRVTGQFHAKRIESSSGGPVTGGEAMQALVLPVLILGMRAGVRRRSPPGAFAS